MSPEREVDIDPLFERRLAELLESSDLGLRERLIREVRERGAVPEAERLAQDRRGCLLVLHRTRRPGLAEQVLEADDVHAGATGVERIARLPRQHRLVA